MVHYCCVYGCRSKWSSGCDIKFHSFPSKKEIAVQWQVAIRTGKVVSKFMKVCSKHFKTEDYTESTTPGYYFLNPQAVPSQNLPTRSHEKGKPENVDRRKRAARPRFNVNRRRSKVGVPFVDVLHVAGRNSMTVNTAMSDFAPDLDSDQIPIHFDDVECIVEEEVSESSNTASDGLTESGPYLEVAAVVASEEILHCSDSQDQSHVDGVSLRDSVKGIHQETQTVLKTLFLSMSDVTEEQLKYFTGLPRERFQALYHFCMRSNPVVPKICDLPEEDQLLLVLCKYKLNLDYVLISTLFKVDRRVASELLFLWTDLMYPNFTTIDWWSTKLQRVDLYTVIIDCTKIPTVRSSNPEYHQHMFSNYKNRPTLKGLVGIDETGVVIFCSELYGGSTSDKQMVNLSGFLDKLDKGDTVLADRGFDISDLLESKGVALNISPFRRNRDQLAEKEVIFTRFIAQRRIHIERLIGLGKVHQILVDMLPDHLWLIASKIFFNCMMLCNFKKVIVTCW